MGWDTYLTVGGDPVTSWRKQSVPTPAILFRYTDLIVDDTGDRPVVRFETSASRALDNLAVLGFGWNLLLADYTASREWVGGALACMHGEFMARAERSDLSDAHERIEALRAVPPLDELDALGRRLVADVHGVEMPVDEMSKFIPERADSALEAIFEDAPLGISPMHVADLARSAGTRELARPLEYVLSVRWDSPLASWIFGILILLHSLPGHEAVTLDLSDDAYERGYDGTTPKEYADAYWAEARESLAQTARFYGRVFSDLAAADDEVAVPLRFARIESLLASASATGLTNSEKGLLLEDLIGEVVQLSDGLEVLEKRVRHDDEELDLVLRNDLKDSFWLALNSPLVVVESKNWSSRVGTDELRVLESKIKDRESLCRVGIFVSLNGFSRPFLQRVRKIQAQGTVVFPVDGDDIAGIARSNMPLDVWLKDVGLRRIL